MGLLLTAPVLFAQTPAPTPAHTSDPAAKPAAHRHHKSHKEKAQAQLVLPPLPSGPLSQMPMEQIPPTPAKVTYQGGLLTISAQNSTLSEILRDVRKLTGASIEIPQGANERVVTSIGPGAPRDVLAVLLNGTAFNYVMVGSETDPTAVSSLILTAKSSASGESQSAANVYQNSTAQNNPPPMVPPVRFPGPQAFSQQNIASAQPGNPQPIAAQPADAEADDSKDDDASADDNADDQAQPGQPAQPEASAQEQAQPSDPNQPNAGPKTPEQILEMLRRPPQPGASVMPQPQPQQQ